MHTDNFGWNPSMSESAFGRLMTDPNIQNAITSLNVRIHSCHGGVARLFKMIDTDEDGIITVHQLVRTLVKLGGDVEKLDFVELLHEVRRLAGPNNIVTSSLKHQALSLN